MIAVGAGRWWQAMARPWHRLVGGRDRIALTLAAIAKNERAAMPEWVAWHRLQGFDRLAVVDNGSTDGTAEYLEALAQLGLCEVLHIGKCDGFQVHAYQQLLALPSSAAAVLCFVDLDEFVVSDRSGCSAGMLLRQAFADPTVGAVGMNWRLFGSNGRRTGGAEPVTQRFLTHASDTTHSINLHIKTAVRVRSCRRFYVHNALIDENARYLDGALADAQFIDHPRTRQPVARATAFTARAGGALRVHHYVIKSEQEFEAKAMRRSVDAAIPLNWDAKDFFRAHDLNDERCELLLDHAAALRLEMDWLDRQLRERSHFHRALRGGVDAVSPHEIVGWLADDAPHPVTPAVKVYVNGHWQGRCKADRARPDGPTGGSARRERHAFRLRFQPALQPGDTVHVRACANPTPLDHDTHVIA